MCQLYGRFLQLVSKINLVSTKSKSNSSPVNEVQGTAMAGVHEITDLDEIWFPENGIQFHLFYRNDIYRHPGSKQLQCLKSSCTKHTFQALFLIDHWKHRRDSDTFFFITDLAIITIPEFEFEFTEKVIPICLPFKSANVGEGLHQEHDGSDLRGIGLQVSGL